MDTSDEEHEIKIFLKKISTRLIILIGQPIIIIGLLISLLKFYHTELVLYSN